METQGLPIISHGMCEACKIGFWIKFVNPRAKLEFPSPGQGSNVLSIQDDTMLFQEGVKGYPGDIKLF